MFIHYFMFVTCIWQHKLLYDIIELKIMILNWKCPFYCMHILVCICVFCTCSMNAIGGFDCYNTNYSFSYCWLLLNSKYLLLLWNCIIKAHKLFLYLFIYTISPIPAPASSATVAIGELSLIIPAQFNSRIHFVVDEIKNAITISLCPPHMYWIWIIYEQFPRNAYICWIDILMSIFISVFN